MHIINVATSMVNDKIVSPSSDYTVKYKCSRHIHVTTRNIVGDNLSSTRRDSSRQDASPTHAHQDATRVRDKLMHSLLAVSAGIAATARRNRAELAESSWTFNNGELGSDIEQSC